MQLELLQPLLLLFQARQLGLAHAIEAAVENETHHLVQLSAIQKCPVGMACVDDRSGQPSEILAVHHFPALGTWPVPDAFGIFLHRSGRLS